MQIELKEITIADLVDGYTDAGEEGVMGYSGRLNIRPKYQREFVYNVKQRDAVVRSVLSGFPLNTMYWGVTGDGYELIDGQQRTVSMWVGLVLTESNLSRGFSSEEVLK